MIPQHILVGSDFSATSRLALDWALDLAATVGARVTLLHVFDLPIVGVLDASLLVDARTAARLSDEAQAALDAELARVRGRGVPVAGVLKQGDPRLATTEMASSAGCDLLVVGSHGRTGVARALLGSVAETLVRTADVPVVVVRVVPVREAAAPPR